MMQMPNSGSGAGNEDLAEPHRLASLVLDESALSPVQEEAAQFVQMLEKIVGRVELKKDRLLPRPPHTAVTWAEGMFLIPVQQGLPI